MKNIEKISEYLISRIKEVNEKYATYGDLHEPVPKYLPSTHVLELTRSKYYHLILILRHFLKNGSDDYFGNILKGFNIDLFMMTPSVSSPMGPGSDSEPIEIKFGNLFTNLVDSSQFGFEPILLNDFDLVYCYLPSMRGEDADKRHLNQFYHCEAEIKGDLNKLLPIIEQYIKNLATIILLQDNIIRKISLNYEKTKEFLTRLCEYDSFPRITCEYAIKVLEENDLSNLVNYTQKGNDISSEGEIQLARILNFDVPYWLTHFDRDRVPFYQKPDPENKNKVINADLIFPPIIEQSFGGEIVGCGERQNLVEEMYESLKRQNVNSANYEWYINIRKIGNYRTTSGFGIGIERFITWALAIDDIKKVIPYPRLKNIVTYP